jgi:hypothetical protein
VSVSTVASRGVPRAITASVPRLNSANCPTTGINTVALGSLAWPSIAAVRRSLIAVRARSEHRYENSLDQACRQIQACPLAQSVRWRASLWAQLRRHRELHPGRESTRFCLPLRRSSMSQGKRRRDAPLFLAGGQLSRGRRVGGSRSMRIPSRPWRINRIFPRGDKTAPGAGRNGNGAQHGWVGIPLRLGSGSPAVAGVVDRRACGRTRNLDGSGFVILAGLHGKLGALGQKAAESLLLSSPLRLLRRDLRGIGRSPCLVVWCIC